jgi:solute carrier family 35 protein F5
MLIQYGWKHGLTGMMRQALDLVRECRNGTTPLKAGDDDDDDVEERLLVDDEGSMEALALSASSGSLRRRPVDDKLSFRETAWLSLEFCMLWFTANYFASACLEYTSVGSVTIITSLSSVFTLLFCAVMHVEAFTLRKLIGVLASLAGVILISTVDLSGSSDKNRGNFPHKSQTQIAIGDAMAFISAIVYGLYVTVMKQKVGNEDRVNMPLFFGLVGLFNVLFLWPGFFILHFTGIEPVRS